MPVEAGRAAHSIYFQILGELGIIGLIFYLCILVGSIRRANRIMKLCSDQWMRDMASTLKMSIVAYMIGGAALSFAYFDVLYAYVALLIVLDSRLEKDLSK